MAVTVTNLLQGPAELFHGAFGAVEPANAAAAPGVAWTDLGGTDGGATLTFGQTYSKMTVDQVPMGVDARLQEQMVQVATSLAEGTLDNLKRAMNADPDASLEYEFGDDIGNASPLFSAVLIRGQKPGGGPRLIAVRRCLSVENVAMAWTKDNKTMIPVTFEGYYISTSVKAARINDAVS